MDLASRYTSYEPGGCYSSRVGGNGGDKLLVAMDLDLDGVDLDYWKYAGRVEAIEASTDVFPSSLSTPLLLPHNTSNSQSFPTHHLPKLSFDDAAAAGGAPGSARSRLGLTGSSIRYNSNDTADTATSTTSATATATALPSSASLNLPLAPSTSLFKFNIDTPPLCANSILFSPAGLLATSNATAAASQTHTTTNLHASQASKATDYHHSHHHHQSTGEDYFGRHHAQSQLGLGLSPFKSEPLLVSIRPNDTLLPISHSEGGSNGQAAVSQSHYLSPQTQVQPQHVSQAATTEPSTLLEEQNLLPASNPVRPSTSAYSDGPFSLGLHNESEDLDGQFDFDFGIQHQDNPNKYSNSTRSFLGAGAVYSHQDIAVTGNTLHAEPISCAPNELAPPSSATATATSTNQASGLPSTRRQSMSTTTTSGTSPSSINSFSFSPAGSPISSSYSSLSSMANFSTKALEVSEPAGSAYSATHHEQQQQAGPSSMTGRPSSSYNFMPIPMYDIPSSTMTYDHAQSQFETQQQCSTSSHSHQLQQDQSAGVHMPQSHHFPAQTSNAMQMTPLYCELYTHEQPQPYFARQETPKSHSQYQQQPILQDETSKQSSSGRRPAIRVDTTFYDQWMALQQQVQLCQSTNLNSNVHKYNDGYSISAPHDARHQQPFSGLSGFLGREAQSSTGPYDAYYSTASARPVTASSSSCYTASPASIHSSPVLYDIPEIQPIVAPKSNRSGFGSVPPLSDAAASSPTPTKATAGLMPVDEAEAPIDQDVPLTTSQSRRLRSSNATETDGPRTAQMACDNSEPMFTADHIERSTSVAVHDSLTPPSRPTTAPPSKTKGLGALPCEQAFATSLDELDDVPYGSKPPYLWWTLIRAAILGAPGSALQMETLTHLILHKYPYFGSTKEAKNWKSSIRSVIHTKPCFYKSEDSAGNVWWHVDVEIDPREQRRGLKKRSGSLSGGSLDESAHETADAATTPASVAPPKRSHHAKKPVQPTDNDAQVITTARKRRRTE